MRDLARRPRGDKITRAKILKDMRVLMLQGVPAVDIRTTLKLPYTSFYRYWNKLHTEFVDRELKQESHLLGQYAAKIQETDRLLAAEYNQKKDPAILKHRADVLHASFDRLQSAGFIRKIKDKAALEDVNFTFEVVHANPVAPQSKAGRSVQPAPGSDDK